MKSKDSRDFRKPKDKDTKLPPAKIRALNLIWRALQDGVCPNCNSHFAADKSIAVGSVEYYGFGGYFGCLQCPYCKFIISGEEIHRIKYLFNSQMKKSLSVFKKWQQNRIKQTEREFQKQMEL